VRLLWQATAAGEQLTVEASECQQLKNIMRRNHLPQAGHHKRRFR